MNSKEKRFYTLVVVLIFLVSVIFFSTERFYQVETNNGMDYSNGEKNEKKDIKPIEYDNEGLKTAEPPEDWTYGVKAYDSWVYKYTFVGTGNYFFEEQEAGYFIDPDEENVVFDGEVWGKMIRYYDNGTKEKYPDVKLYVYSLEAVKYMENWVGGYDPFGNGPFEQVYKNYGGKFINAIKTYTANGYIIVDQATGIEVELFLNDINLNISLISWNDIDVLDLDYGISENYNPQPVAPFNNYNNGFQNNTLVGWVFSVRNTTFSFSDYYFFNITENKLLYNASGQNRLDYCSQLQLLYYNISQGFQPDKKMPLINVSCINFSLREMSAIDSNKISTLNNLGFGGLALCFALNLFIPRDGSHLIDTNFSASALSSYYLPILNGGYDNIVNTSNTIVWQNTITGAYIKLVYNNHTGILKTGEMYTNITGKWEWYNLTRYSDFNPIAGIEWEYKIDDVFYLGWNNYENMYKIVDIITKSVRFMGKNLTVQCVYANISVWNGAIWFHDP
ncbi:MAG: hypothetical protein ACTSPD_15810, partial [Promethearchaeota archaeon]